MAFHFSMDVSALEARGPVAGDEWQLCHWSERPSCMKPTASTARNVALADDPKQQPIQHHNRSGGRAQGGQNQKTIR